MAHERMKEILDGLLGYLADKYGVDGMFEIAHSLGVNDEELSSMGWPSEDQD